MNGGATCGLALRGAALRWRRTRRGPGEGAHIEREDYMTFNLVPADPIPVLYVNSRTARASISRALAEARSIRQIVVSNPTDNVAMLHQQSSDRKDE